MNGRRAICSGGTSGWLWYHVAVPTGDHRGTTTMHTVIIRHTSCRQTCWRREGRKRSCQLGHEGGITGHVRRKRGESSPHMSTTSSLRRQAS